MNSQRAGNKHCRPVVFATLMNSESPITDRGDEDPTKAPTHEEIAKLAYQFYTEEGCLEGRDQANWEAAERHLLEVRAKTATDRTIHLGVD